MLRNFLQNEKFKAWELAAQYLPQKVILEPSREQTGRKQNQRQAARATQELVTRLDIRGSNKRWNAELVTGTSKFLTHSLPASHTNFHTIRFTTLISSQNTIITPVTCYLSATQLLLQCSYFSQISVAYFLLSPNFNFTLWLFKSDSIVCLQLSFRIIFPMWGALC